MLAVDEASKQQRMRINRHCSLPYLSLLSRHADHPHGSPIQTPHSTTRQHSTHLANMNRPTLHLRGRCVTGAHNIPIAIEPEFVVSPIFIPRPHEIPRKIIVDFDNDMMAKILRPLRDDQKRDFT